MQPVASFLDPDMGAKRRTEQREIPDEINDFVADEFVGPMQTTAIENPRVIEHEGVVQASAMGETRFVQCGDLIGEYKSTSGRELRHEGAFVEVRDLEKLPADTGMREVDRI